MRFEIVVDDEDRNDPINVKAGTPWNASLFPIADDGESGELQGVGVGATVADAVRNLLSDLDDLPEDWCWESEDHRHQVTSGSCDQCGAKNFS